MSKFQLSESAQQVMDSLFSKQQQAIDNVLGFPMARDLDFTGVALYASRFMNNIGDPFVAGSCQLDIKDLERSVLDFFAKSFNAPANNYWGYVTSGSTEGNLYGLYMARGNYPEGVVYYSEAAHYSIPKNIHLLGMTGCNVGSQASGELDYDAFRLAVATNAGKPAIVVANIGTTMTEAMDHVATIRTILQDLAVEDVYIHSDAALAGCYAGFVQGASYDFADGVDSISVSGHKFLGVTMPCGAVIIKDCRRKVVQENVPYIDSPDSTISGSRSGHTVLGMWYALEQVGTGRMRERYVECLELAKYTETQLRTIGWEAWRNPHAITTVLKAPPKELCYRWQLATEGQSHIICMPGVLKGTIDEFIADLRQSIPPKSNSISKSVKKLLPDVA